MSRRALAAPLAFALLAVPAFAQQQGAPSDLHERDVPGTRGVAAVPGLGEMTDSGKGRGPVNNPNGVPTGTAGAKLPFRTGPLQGGGGPDGPSSPKPQADVGTAAPIVLAQADVQAQSQEPGTTAPPSAAGTTAAGSRNMRVQQQLHDLYARLHITAAQAPQWNAFAHTLEANAQHMQALWASRPARPASALEDMRDYTQMAQAHAEDMQKLVAAFTPLYESLSPDQKAAADQAFRQAATRNGRLMPR